MKKLILVVVFGLLMVVGTAYAVPDLLGDVRITIKATEPQVTVDKHGYHVTKLKTYSFPFSGQIYLYWANPAPHGDVPPKVYLDLSTPSDCGSNVTILVECKSEDGVFVTASANNQTKAVNDKFIAVYNCTLTLNDFDDSCNPRTASTTAVHIHAKGTSKREAGDSSDNITQINLSGCTLAGGGGSGFDSVFTGDFSSVLLP